MSVWPYFSAPARSAWPGRSRVTTLGSKPSFAAVICAVQRALEVALIDVGGTLWPNSWPIRKADAVGRRLRIRAAMPGIEPATVEALADDLIESSRPGDEARSISTENLASVNSPAEM